MTMTLEDAVGARRSVLAGEIDRLRAELRARDEFLAMLGHELRNPLSPIVTALQLMRHKSDTDVGRERAVIERQIELLIRLVDDLLDAARIATGKIELRRTRCDVAAVVTTAVELATPAIEQRHHRLEVDAMGTDLWVDGDPSRLVQVLANLLSNAAKYTSQGGSIVVRAWRDDGEVMVTVQDDGIGIPGELLPHVFDLYVQGEETPRRPARCQQGLGIGLSIVKRLVALHGGSVSASSPGAGAGSTFTVRLPAVVPLANGTAPIAMIPTTRPQRVLIVDDNVDVAELYGEVLRRHGHAVLVAHNGLAALQLAEAFRPDVAMIDIGLPIMAGHELAAAMREHLGNRCPRLLAISGYAPDFGGDDEDAARAGFESYLVKPIEMGRLLALVGEPG